MQIGVFEEIILSELYKHLDSVKIPARNFAGVLTFYVGGTTLLPLGRETKLHCRMLLKEYTLIFYVFICDTGNSLGILRRFLPVVFWIIRTTANPVEHSSCLFYYYCNNMFRPKGPSSSSACWPNVVVFGCNFIRIDFGISGSMFSVYLTPFELCRVCKPNLLLGFPNILRLPFDIQGVSGGTVNILGGGSMDYSE